MFADPHANLEGLSYLNHGVLRLLDMLVCELQHQHARAPHNGALADAAIQAKQALMQLRSVRTHLDLSREEKTDPMLPFSLDHLR